VGEVAFRLQNSQTVPTKGKRSKHITKLILGFRRYVDDNCVLLEYYEASCGNYLPTFRDNLSVPSSRFKSLSRKGHLTREDETDILSRNVGKQLPHDVA
jgi:hypothetical protein